jgi:hypothetical protein
MYFIVSRVMKFEPTIAAIDAIHDVDQVKTIMETRSVIHSLQVENVSTSMEKKTEDDKDKGKEGKTPENQKQNDTEKKVVVVKEWIGNECPFCMETMEAGDIVYVCTRQCGNSFHRECFNKWIRFHKKTECFYCRTEIPFSNDELQRILLDSSVSKKRKF